MDVRVAKTFLIVAETKSITRAAELLGYTQSAVTQQLKQMEQHLGVKLFDRLGRGVELTAAGQSFIPYAVNLVKASEDADSFYTAQQEVSGNLVIDSSSTVADCILSRLLPAFSAQYPKVHIAVRVSEDIDILVGRVRQGRSDLAVFINPREDYSGCIKAAERKERFCFVASPSDPVVKKEFVSLQEVFDGNFVSSFITTDRNDGFLYLIEPELRRMGISVNPTLEFGTSAPILRVLKEGCARSFLPYVMVADEIRAGRLSLIRTELLEVNVWCQAFYSANRWLSPQMHALIQHLNLCFSEDALFCDA